MSHIFILHPDINLLEEYRYWDISLPTTSPVYIEVGTINTDKERKSVEDNFRELLEEYQISEHYETFLTICLSLLNWLSKKKEAAYETFQYKHKVKQTASLFQYFKAKDGKVDIIRSLPQSIKLTFNSNDFIKIDNAELVL